MVLAVVGKRLTGVQAILAFENWTLTEYPQFASKMSIGRVALLGSVLGFAWGFHLVLGIQLTLHVLLAPLGASPLPPTIIILLGYARLRLLWQWCLYAVALASFHLLEFFVTAFYNPTQTSADSFLVNHSTAYTAAALTSWTEFAIRFLFFPRRLSFGYPYLPCLGLVLVVASQAIRSIAMATAGESFNHFIQDVKKDNHVLITHGIYSTLRHPSYVGFFYWSVGTQLLLGNMMHTILFAVVSWRFFRTRIDYEENSLCDFFPDTYPAYVARTYSGIPFLKSRVEEVLTRRGKVMPTGAKHGGIEDDKKKV